MRISLLRGLVRWGPIPVSRCMSQHQPVCQKFIPLNTHRYCSPVVRSLCTVVEKTIASDNQNLDSKPKVKNTVYNIVDYVSKNISVKMDEQNAISVVGYLINESIPPQHIASGMKSKPGLLGIPADKYQRAVTLLKDYGFKNDQIMPILHSHSGLFEGNTEQLYGIGDALRHIGYRDGALQKLICKDPILLELSPSDIVQQFRELRETFKAIEIIAMALDTPSILYEEFSELEKKIDYIHDTMGIDHEVIAKCYVLGFPLLRIKARHLFLERAGVYKKPNPKKVMNFENPSLSKMVRFKDKRFAKKIAEMTEAEYKAFAKIVALEEEDKRDKVHVRQSHVGEEVHSGFENDEEWEESTHGDDDDDDDEIDMRSSYKKWKPKQ